MIACVTDFRISVIVFRAYHVSIFFQGEDVLELSSEMIKTGSVESLFGGKREKIHLNLFDHQLIFCKVVCISIKVTFR